MNSYQTVAPLTIGELWAWPSMLKLALIENLRRLAEEMLAARAARRAADAYLARIDAGGRRARCRRCPRSSTRPSSSSCCSGMREYGPRLAAVRAAVDEHLRAPAHDRGGGDPRASTRARPRPRSRWPTSITSLRLCSTLDWSQYFEAVSLVEHVLQRDPAGVYASMDFLSRDRYRQAVEELAEPHRRGPGARGPARGGERAAGRGDAVRRRTRAAHVGYHLIGKGRPRPRDRRRLPSAAARSAAGASSSRHATGVYLGSIAVLTAPLAGAGRGLRRAAQGASAVAAGGRRCCCSCPRASWPSRSCSGWPRAWLRRGGSRASSSPAASPRTRARWSIVPTLLTSVAEVEELVEHLEVLALGNLDPHIHFAILGDFPDAPAREMPEDEAILEAARGGHRGAERARWARAAATASTCSTAGAGGTRREGVWMGWERKRGKIEEFNRLLRGATDTSFARAGRATSTILPRVRYCITLDSDTRLPREAAREADRHHRPSAEPAALRPAPGPGDRGLRHPAAARQRHHGQRGGVALRAHLRRPHRRRSLHHRGVGHLPGPVRRGDLHGQGPLRRRRLHGRARGPRARERAPLPRPVRGRLRAHRARHRRRGGGRLSLERARPRAPPAPLGARRLADPAAGCSRCVPTRGGASSATACRSISRWKIFDNLRRSLRAAGHGGAAPGRPGPLLPGSAARLDGGRRPRRSPSPSTRCCSASWPDRGRQQPWGVFLRGHVARTKTALGAARPPAHVPRLPRLRDAARHRAHPRAPGASPSGGCWNGRRPRRPPRARAGLARATARASSSRRWGPARSSRAGRLLAGPGRAPGRAARGRCPCWCCGWPRRSSPTC